MRVVIIGTGNVAYHVLRAVAAAGHDILCIASRTADHAIRFARMADTLAGHPDDVHVCQSTDDVSTVPADADIYLIAVSDDAVYAVSERLPHINGVVAHTSGATSIDMLCRHDNRAVIYPCQTFTRADSIDFSEVPLMIEASNAESEHIAAQFASSLSDNVSRATSQQRLHLHIAAVLASNFTNHLIALAKEHSESNGIDYNVLHSLVSQTIDKAFRIDPVLAQTGPAQRHDAATISRHLQMIDDPSVRNVYETLTRSIQNHKWK